MTGWGELLDALDVEVERLLATAGGDVERVLEPPPTLDPDGPCPPELAARAATIAARLHEAEAALRAARTRVRAATADGAGGGEPLPRYLDTRL